MMLNSDHPNDQERYVALQVELASLRQQYERLDYDLSRLSLPYGKRQELLAEQGVYLKEMVGVYIQLLKLLTDAPAD